MNDMDKSSIFKDDTFIQIFGNDPIIDVKEFNVESELENFDIEVYRVEENFNRKIGGNDKLIRLNFAREKQEIVDGFLVDDDGYDSSMAFIDRNNVEYYFDLQTDMNIDKRQLCAATTQLKTDNYFIDLPIDCEDVKERARMDIYGPSGAEPEVCD